MLAPDMFKCIALEMAVCPFPFGHCVVCLSSIYGFSLPPLVSSNSSYCFKHVFLIYHMVERGYIWMGYQVCREEFEDTKGVFRIRKSKKNRQHNEHINHGCVPFVVNTSRSIHGLSL
jgi:hypothetical protein